MCDGSEIETGEVSVEFMKSWVICNLTSRAVRSVNTLGWLSVGSQTGVSGRGVFEIKNSNEVEMSALPMR